MDNQQPSINRKLNSKNALKYPVNIGDIFGVYKVIEELKIPSSKCFITKWKCINMNTDQEYISSGGYLHKLKRRVDAKFDKERQLGLRNWLYKYSQKNAKSRNHIFNLSFEEFNSLIVQNCYYCGEPPKEVSKKTLKARGDTHQPPISYNGVDRLNPKDGYVLYNCVGCCSTCNYMKHIQQKSEFLNQIIKIYNHSINKGSTTIPEGSTLQANGNGNRKLLTGNAEDEDIVSPL
jgi:hypothetical protein